MQSSTVETVHKKEERFPTFLSMQAKLYVLLLGLVRRFGHYIAKIYFHPIFLESSDLNLYMPVS